MINKLTTFLFLQFVLILAATVHADERGAAFLKIGGMAHSSPLGFAAVALSGHVDALFWNPAGIGLISRGQFGLTYARWIQDTNFGTLNGAIRLNENHLFGVSIRHLSVSEISRRYSSEDVEPKGFFNATNTVLGVSHSFSLFHLICLNGEYSANV